MDYSIVIMVVSFVVVLLGIFFVQRFMMLRAVKTVVNIFRECHATSIDNAKTLDELGLKPRSFASKLYHIRDYKPRVVDWLMNNEIVVMTEDGRLYLQEDKLPEKMNLTGPR
jgi:hypothetical protein